MGIVSKRLRESARGQECTFQIPYVCNRDPSTTVLAHIRDDAKGMGNKANDFSAAFACSACHEEIDQHRWPPHTEAFYCMRAMQRTIMWWIENGYLVIAGEKERKPREPSKKSLPPKPSWRFRAIQGGN